MGDNSQRQAMLSTALGHGLPKLVAKISVLLGGHHFHKFYKKNEMQILAQLFKLFRTCHAHENKIDGKY